MRNVVFLLAVLLGFKLMLGQWHWRASAEEAVVAAYGAKAVEACRNDAKARGYPPAQPLSRTGEVRLVVGASDVDVWFWDVGNPSWSRRYRTPYLRLQLQSGDALLQCAYDINNKVSIVTRW